MPEAGTVTMQQIRLIPHQKDKKGPNGDLCHHLPQPLEISYKHQNIPAVSYTVVPQNPFLKP